MAEPKALPEKPGALRLTQSPPLRVDPGLLASHQDPLQTGVRNGSIRRATSSAEAGPLSTATDINKHSLAFRGAAVSVTEFVTKIANCREKRPGQLRLFL